MDTLVALLGFAFTIAFAPDRLAVVTTSVPVAAFWSWWMMGLLPMAFYRIVPGASKMIVPIVPPPRRIGPDQLPPAAAAAVGIWKAIATGMVFTTIMWAAFVVFFLTIHEYFPIGILLSGPIASWDRVRKIKRAEHEEHGVLWNTIEFAKRRSWYLVTGA